MNDIIFNEQFTPEIQQKFREVTAAAVVDFCSKNLCNIVLLDGETKG